LGEIADAARRRQTERRRAADDEAAEELLDAGPGGELKEAGASGVGAQRQRGDFGRAAGGQGEADGERDAGSVLRFSGVDEVVAAGEREIAEASAGLGGAARGAVRLIERERERKLSALERADRPDEALFEFEVGRV